MEVAQGRDRPRAGLNLVEKEERLAGSNPLASRQLQLLDQHGWTQITREQRLQEGPLFEVDRGDVPELGPAKLIDGPGLSALAWKYPDADCSWQWVFPASGYNRDGETGRLLLDGYDIRTVQDLLGHNDVKTTMIYTHVLNTGGRGVAARPTGYRGRRSQASRRNDRDDPPHV